MLTKGLLVVLFLGVSLAAQNREEYHIANVPGTLETVILRGKIVVHHELGSLTPPGRVTLFAVVAVDESTKQRAKGLEVQLEGDDVLNGNRHCEKSAYIDEDGLLWFERRLTGLVEDERRDMNNSEGTRSETPSVVMAANAAYGHSKDGVFYVPVQFGSYWTGSRFGVYVDSPYSESITSTSQPTCQFNMPKADISELLSLVRAGRLWLSKEVPNSGHSDVTER